MDWELKMPWELVEVEPNAEAGIGLMVGQGSGLAIEAGHGRLDCSVDLKLGGLGDFGPAEKWKEQQHRAAAAAATSSPSGSSKRARALSSSSSQNVACLVDGCKSDLSNCREYYRRHKVCEDHSKTPIVTVGGQEQRFCQQCSRFHLLVEFDEVKRSCRKRLDGHNRRRRKPQPESNSGSLFANHHQGNRYSSYLQTFPTATSDPAWPITVKTEEEPLYSHHQPPVDFLDRQHHHFSSSFSRSIKEGKHCPFLQDSDRATLEPSICQPLLKTISSDGRSSSSSSNKIFSSGLTQVLDSNCALSCALSLLSSQPQTSSINLGQIVPSADRIPMGQPLLSYGGGLGLGQYSGSHQASNHVSTTGFSCSGMEDDHVGSTVLVSHASDPEMNCQGLFAIGGEGSSDGGSQALPFFWQ